MSMIGALLPLTAPELEELKRRPARGHELIGRQGEVSLEKMWQALHFMLTGKAQGGAAPLGDAILGGTEVGPDLGYGPARYLTPDRVRAVSAALQALSRDEMRRRFQPAALQANDIYPMVWDEPPEDLLDELMGYFDAMVACYRAAAARGDGMLLSLT